MCGRFTLTKPPDAITRHFAHHLGLDAAALRLAEHYAPRYNIAPTQNVFVLRAREGQYELAEARWGLIPAWSRDAAIGARLINARAETVAEKPAFRDSLRARRCLVPADGFYEWKAAGKRKQPWHISLDHAASLFAFAGLWDRWRSPAGDCLETCTIVTTAPNQRLAELHDRMPAILPPEDYRAWLEAEASEALALLRPYPAEAFRTVAVSPLVSRPQNEGPECLQPLAI